MTMMIVTMPVSVGTVAQHSFIKPAGCDSRIRKNDSYLRIILSLLVQHILTFVSPIFFGLVSLPLLKMRFTLLSCLIACSIPSVICDAVISSFPNSLDLPANFDPVKPAYWTGLAHHRRTPFSVSPDGKSAYLAYLDSSYKNVHVQQVDVSTFKAVGTAVSISGFEAAGLVAQNDGFALMATVSATGTTGLPPNNYPIVALIRYKNGVEAWRTPLNGPGVHAAAGVCIVSSYPQDVQN
jgi:hypothetical protein